VRGGVVVKTCVQHATLLVLSHTTRNNLDEAEVTRTGGIGGDQRHVLVLADDLSGAAEAAAGFIGRGLGVEVLLHAGVPSRPVTVLDLHTRRLCVADAEDAVAQALSIADGRQTIIKIDSLLRGPIDATVRAAAATGRPVIIAAGNPKLGRTVVEGVVLVDGIPLDQTDLWTAESAPAPRSIAEAAGRTRSSDRRYHLRR